MYKILFVCGALLAGLLSQQSATPPASSTTLNYEVFKTKIEPIFLNKRPGHARCVSCHASNNVALHLVPLSPGETMWNEEESRKNFELVQRVAIPGDLQSPLLIHPLLTEAGGDFFHSGGKHFNSQNDPEWLTIKAWILGQSGK
jgi:hypothetical protein